MIKTVSRLGLVFMSFIFVAQAELTVTNDGAVPAGEGALAPLVNYVLKEGKPNTAEAYILKNLHLGDKDVAVIQKGWVSHRDKLNHLVAVSAENKNDVLILLYDKKVEGVCWLTSWSGSVRATVAFSLSTHTSRVISNEVDLKAFESEKKYLLERLSAELRQKR